MSNGYPMVVLSMILLAILSYSHANLENELVIEAENSMDTPLTLHEQIERCFHEKEIIRDDTSRPIRTKVRFNSSHDPVLIVDDWIDEIYATNIMMLAHCVKDIAPEQHEYRPFGDDGYGGGNNVTFLNEVMQSVYPEALDHIIDVSGVVVDGVGWRPHPSHLGIRCIELLEYGEQGELTWHDDEDSTYTMSIMISDTTWFTGGTFLIDRAGNTDTTPTNPKDIMRASPKQYGGLIFDSHALHAVTPIKSGMRVVLVLELWPFVDSSFDDYRPDIKVRTIRPKIPRLMRVN
jgi:hypothetical protein